jgi:hypothetical protein
MKISIIAILFPLSISLFAQKKVAGRYRDYFGYRIELNADSTFKYTWNFDMQSSWTKGTWTFKNDTVYFTMVAIYDTVGYKNSNGASTDKLILSVDDVSERLTPGQYAGLGLTSYWQNRMDYPNKLFFKKGRLYKIRNGQRVVKKQKGLWSTKKWNPWFFKSDD